MILYASVGAVVAALEGLGDLPSTEGGSLAASRFTELDHALQTAAILAERFPAEPELHVAGLVHDLGHLFATDEEHARAGARSVRAVLGARVAALVGAHVEAKRYLVAVDPDYRRSLSEGSLRSLEQQGGPMPADDVVDVEAKPFWTLAVALRRADDEAKVPGRHVPGLDRWRPVLEHVGALAETYG